METLESLKEMLGTTDDIRTIVRTMKSLSAASIRQFEEAEAAVSAYQEIVDLGLTALLRDRHARGLPLPGPVAPGGMGALLVIGSDRGLCGGYNEIVARHAAGMVTGETRLLAVIGARAAARLEAAGHDVGLLMPLPGSVAGMTPLVRRVIVEIERWTREAGVGQVRLVHNRREGPSHAVPSERALLPIPEAHLRGLLGRGWPGQGLPFYRMEPGRLLSWLVRQHTFVVLYRALAEAMASEHATRLAAMQRAERNIEERREALTALYRRKRQETITRELLDVVAGFEAVRGADD